MTTDRDMLAANLEGILGAGAVITDADELAFYSADVYSAGITAALAIVPAQRDLLGAAVKCITAAGYAVIPRGGGMSYTSGYTPVTPESVIVDLRRLDQILDINADDMTVTVEAGVTWQQAYEALQPLGLRLPFFGTFSGSRATVGGGMSNGALFMGTARYGTAAEIALGFEVVTAGGETLHTGQAAFENGKPFYRTYGPDLTGLFIHDAGALGIKTVVTMRVIRPPQVADYASFVFDNVDGACSAMSDIARAGVTEECYVFDPATTRNSLDGSDLRRDLKRLLGVVRAQGGLIRGMREGAALIGAGRDFMDKDVFSLHVVCSADTDAAVQHDLQACRDAVDRHHGGEIANSIPKAARANPFEPLNGILGADGGRWAALNSKISHSDAPALIAATDELVTGHSDAMQRCGVSMSRLFIAISNHAFSFEPVLRWHDEWLPVHRRTPEPGHLAKFEEPLPNPEARALVHTIRGEIVALFAQFGAASNQIGKTYPYFVSLRPQSAALVLALKRVLDPQDLMNPGALGIPPR